MGPKNRAVDIQVAEEGLGLSHTEGAERAAVRGASMRVEPVKGTGGRGNPIVQECEVIRFYEARIDRNVRRVDDAGHSRERRDCFVTDTGLGRCGESLVVCFESSLNADSDESTGCAEEDILPAELHESAPSTLSGRSISATQCPEPSGPWGAPRSTWRVASEGTEHDGSRARRSPAVFEVGDEGLVDDDERVPLEEFVVAREEE
jgi:hypothetical protein